MIKNHLIACALFVAFLTGCQTTATLSPTSKIPPSNGVVIFKMNSNTPSIGFFQYWKGANVSAVGKNNYKNFVIGYSSGGNSRTAVYLGSLPEGEYRLTGFSSEQCGAVCISSSIELPESIGTFEVKAGKITELGHLLYDQIDASKSLIVPGKSTDNWAARYLTTFYPNIITSFQPQEMLHWKVANPMLQQLYSSVRADSKGLLRPSQTGDGSVLFGSYLGAVRMWRPGKPIVNFDTGIQGAIESVTELAQDVWLAGSENGQLVQTVDGGRTWELLSSGFPGFSITGLYTYKGKVFATASNRNEMSIYRRTESNSNWAMVYKQKLAFSFWTGVSKLSETKMYKGKLVTTLPSEALVVTDMDSELSVERKFPGGLADFALGQDGVLRCIATKSIAANPYESHDWGKTWIDSKHSRFMSLPYFVDEKTGYGLQGELMAATADLSVSIDGGLTWKSQGPMPYRTPRFSYIEKSNVLFATDDYNKVVFSRDGGKSWY